MFHLLKPDEENLKTGSDGDSEHPKMKLFLEAKGYSCRLESKGIVAQLADPAEFPGMVRTVLNAGIPFTGINQMKENLEDVFLRIMDSERGNDIVS